MNFKKYHVSKNLFDVENVTHEALSSDGSIRYESAMNLSGLIRVDGDYTVSWSAVRSGAYMRVSTYDDNKNFIARIAEPNTYTRSSYSNTHTGYIRINYENSYQLSDIMLNTGSQPLPYEPYGDTWHDIPHYIHNTSTDTITTLPADIYANDTTATVGLKGQMEQSGTPTPTTPIQPQECGDMSSNLWSYHPDTTSGGVRLLWDGEKIKYSNTCTYASNSVMTIDLKKGTYTLKVNANRIPIENDYSCIDIYHSSSGLLKQVTNRNAVNGKVTFTLDDDLSNVSLRIRLDNGTNYDGFEIRPMLNIGGTSLPYDVYGQYKIPISSAGQTTPVYLGEVQTTRKIKKVVFNGTEPWNAHATQPNLYTLNNVSDYLHAVNPVPICSHYPTKIVASAGAVGNNELALYYNQGQPSVSVLYIKNTEIASADDFKTYLQQQYAAGTPVTVWYVLATEETGIVNEPLMKIGEYADTLSNVSIPVTAGGDTISVGTTVQPSEVTVNYKGWHPVADVHERNNGAWT